MSLPKYRIVSRDGITRVYDPGGKEMPGVTAIKITHEGGRELVAEITITAINPEVDSLVGVGGEGG